MSRSGSGLSDCWCEKSWLMRIRSSFGTPFLFRPRRRLIAVHRHHRQEQRHPLDQVTFCVQGVSSPLLASRYMNRCLRHWRQQGCGEAFQAHVVAYADDFVILSRGYAEEALAWTRQVMARLGLTVNEAKTTVRDAR